MWEIIAEDVSHHVNIVDPPTPPKKPGSSMFSKAYINNSFKPCALKIAVCGALLTYSGGG